METSLSGCTEKTKAWIKSTVIGLNLCPFARSPFQNDRIKYVPIAGCDAESVLLHLQHELDCLSTQSSDDLETSVLILADGWQHFDEYLDLIELANQLLVDQGLEGVIQIASFHPWYQFADLERDDVRNYTNRSPYPLIHLLREASVSQAVDSHPDVDSIPEKNQAMLLDLGINHFTK